MLVVGIDPGLSRCGYGVLRHTGTGLSNTSEAIAAGVIRTRPDMDHPQRLSTLATELAALLDEFKPTAVAVEGVFANLNLKTAIGVAQAAGLAMAAAASAGCEVAQYTPTQVKTAVTGFGGATKEQVQKMVQVLAQLPEVLQPPDAADAVAVALCHIAHQRVARAS